ncbi:hypothetical protein CL638_01955 [bacterium]|nr:hypothetical protein [bacterium]
MEAITERITRRLKDQIVVTINVLLVTFLFAYFVELPFSVNTAYLTVATFLFAIFASFFTSRQSSRHDSLRESITQFDGNLSSIYRGSGNLSPALQKEIGEIITTHYENLLRSRDWTYHIVHPSETITKIHQTLRKHVGEEMAMPEFKRTSLMQMQWSLRDLQRVRKDKISLMREQVPALQWMLLVLLAVILVVTIMSIQSHTAVVASFLKASFVVAVVLVLALIQDLNRLTLFERLIGEESARDLLKTIKLEQSLKK